MFRHTNVIIMHKQPIKSSMFRHTYVIIMHKQPIKINIKHIKEEDDRNSQQFSHTSTIKIFINTILTKKFC